MKCPFCAEEIQDAALICRFCNRSVTAADAGWAHFVAEYRSLPREKQLERWNKLTDEQKRFLTVTMNPTANQTPAARLWNPGVAAVLGLVIPGAGQIYKGQIIGGLVLLFATMIGYFLLIFPGVILHILSIITAASGNPYAEKG